MINNYGPLVHETVFVMASVRDACSKRVSKGMKLHCVRNDISDMGMKVRIAERTVVLMAKMLVEHFPMFWSENGCAIMMMLRGCDACRSQQQSGRGD